MKGIVIACPQRYETICLNKERLIVFVSSGNEFRYSMTLNNTNLKDAIMSAYILCIT